MRMNLPHQSPTGRFFLAVIFLLLLWWFTPDRGAVHPWIMDLAFVIFVVAGLSDILDGYLARRQNQITAFGRILDPFVDKVLVLGAFIMFLGDNYGGGPGRNLSGLEAWMVVVIVAREMLVSVLRGFSESQGRSYAANWWGKIKMLLQSVTIGWILTSLGRLADIGWVIEGRQILIWVTTLFTAASVVAYLWASRDALAEQARV